jgi:antitoxin component YwqK of YwqJK toxin-antitoxin module
VFVKDGLYEGEFKEYYESGKLKSTVLYVKGKKQGLYKMMSEDGKTVLVTVNYKDDEMTGNYKEVYPNGKTKSEGKYQNGKKEGKWKEYTEDGKVTTAIFKNGTEVIK